MPSKLTLNEALDRSAAFLHEGRLVQATWHSKRSDGQELACALGSFGSNIDSTASCPADWAIPQWFWECVPTLFDGQSADDAFAWWGRTVDGDNAILRRAQSLDGAAWSQIEIKFKIACVRFAIKSAATVCDGKDYWPAVTAAAEQVCAALEGNGDLAAAETAARTAARTARTAAETAARTAARTAAYRDLAIALLNAIEAEIV